MGVAVESTSLQPFTGRSLGLDRRVDPDVSHGVRTRRARPLRLWGAVAAFGNVSSTADAAQAAESCPVLQGASSWRRLRLQDQVREAFFDDRPLQDGSDDLQFPGTAVRAVLHVDVEDALEQPRPADAVRPGRNRLGLAYTGHCDFDGLLLHLGSLRHHQRPQLRVGGQHPVKADQVQPRAAAPAPPAAA